MEKAKITLIFGILVTLSGLIAQLIALVF